jgi:hypothetical protein
MNQHVKELVQLAKKHNKMPVLIKQLQYENSTLIGKAFSDTEIIEMWYDNILKNAYQELTWDDSYTFEVEFLKTLNKWQYRQEKTILHQ